MRLGTLLWHSTAQAWMSSCSRTRWGQQNLEQVLPQGQSSSDRQSFGTATGSSLSWRRGWTDELETSCRLRAVWRHKKDLNWNMKEILMRKGLPFILCSLSRCSTNVVCLIGRIFVLSSWDLNASGQNLMKPKLCWFMQNQYCTRRQQVPKKVLSG